jgi:hypothetical protein
MIPQIEDVGAAAGKQAADLYKAREREGTHDSTRRALPDAVKAARSEAQHLSVGGSEQEVVNAIYWQSYAEAFEAEIKS